jgi:cytochrome oxidase Cu insertion factor (SCO1/SenC/PrrC family)
MRHLGPAVLQLERFFGSWRFPALVLSVLLSFKLLALLVLLVPSAPGVFGAFAEEFKVWCFGYDPAKGTLESAYVGLTLAEPLVLGAVITAVWWRPLRRIVCDRPRAVLPYVAAAVAIVAIGSLALVASRRGGARAEEPAFPARALRTSLPPPQVELIDQEGAPVSLAAMRGRVVMLTGVYASCNYACPMILGQAKRAVAAVSPEERRDVTVVAVTLDPEHDGEESLARMAHAQGVEAPLFHLSWGPPANVARALDDLSIARSRDPATGIIDHPNVFVLVDRAGRVAYRLALGGVQERWLVDALRTLLRERVQDGA